MNKGMQWFTRNTQQVIMARVATFPVVARTGPSSKSGRESIVVQPDENTFIVGKSTVGGKDRIRRVS